MNEECLLLTVEAIWASGVLDYQERIIKDALEEIFCIQRNRRDGQIIQLNEHADQANTMNKP